MEAFCCLQIKDGRKCLTTQWLVKQLQNWLRTFYYCTHYSCIRQDSLRCRGILKGRWVKPGYIKLTRDGSGGLLRTQGIQIQNQILWSLWRCHISKAHEMNHVSLINLSSLTDNEKETPVFLTPWRQQQQKDPPCLPFWGGGVYQATE